MSLLRASVWSTEVVRKQLHRPVPLCTCVTLDSSTITASTDLYETEHVPGMSASDVVVVAIAWRFNRSGGCGTWPLTCYAASARPRRTRSSTAAPDGGRLAPGRPRMG